MKRQLFYRIVCPFAFVLFFSFCASSRSFAQGGSGELPGAKPTPAPPAKGGARPTNRPANTAPAAPVVTTLTFNQSVKGRIDPRSSDKAPNGQVYEQYTLTARGDDLLSLNLQSDNAALTVQILDKDDAEVAIAKDAASGDYKLKTQNGGLPGDGEYKVRVTGPVTGRTAAPFTLTVNRLGLLPGVYNDRFQRIILNYRESEQASVDETLAKLEELAKDDAGKSGAFEFLGIIYLYNSKDIEKAAVAMEQAIKNNGAAVVKIYYDSQWRRMARLRSGSFDWEDPRTGWLRIRPGTVTLTDAGNRSIATVTGAQIKELSKVLTATNNLISITADGARRPFVFLPGTKEQAEADLVIKLIQTHVMGKTN